MIKGAAMLKSVRRRRWVDIFRAWFESGHAVIVIHCKDDQQVRNVQKSATQFKYRYHVTFWTHTHGTDLYLLNPDAIKKSAMEVRQNDEGVIYFYDSTSNLGKLHEALSVKADRRHQV